MNTCINLNFLPKILNIYIVFFFSINSNISSVAEVGSRLPCPQGRVFEYNNRTRVLTCGRQTISSSCDPSVEVPPKVSLGLTPMLLGRFRRKTPSKVLHRACNEIQKTTDHGFYWKIIRISFVVWLERFRRLNSIVFSSLSDKCIDVFV